MLSAADMKTGDTVYIKGMVVTSPDGLFGDKSQVQVGNWVIIVDNRDIFKESVSNPSCDPGRDVFERGQPGHSDNDMGM